MKKTTALLLLAGLLAGTAHAAVEPIQPIRPPARIDLGMVELGKKLYFDRRLSMSGFISCNSCHNLALGGVDHLPTSVGDQWTQGVVNAPTVLNSSLSVAQFWDGRAEDLQEQAGGPIMNPGEMAFSHTLTTAILSTIPGYVREFKQVFGTEKITIQEVTAAIAEFEKTLVTPNSRFDLWLLGDEDALTAEEIAGYRTFKEAGCIQCHNGVAVGGNSFQRMGVVEAYRTDNPTEGRSAVTGKDADRFNFKVPTLRNVELTYPYFHDGATYDLAEAVNLMARLQLGKRFSEQQTEQVVAFLKTLTGEQPYIRMPMLPPSGPRTPPPVPFPPYDLSEEDEDI